MLLKANVENGILVAVIQTREASLQNADEFKVQMITQLNKGYNIAILSFREVEYVDSSFLGALVSSLKHALSLKGDIILADIKEDIYDLLCLIRMDKVFKIYKTKEEAFRKLTVNAAKLSM